MIDDRPALFVELCCGSAAVTLKLLGGVHARPPVSYMGAKTGYAEPILWAMGLRSGQGADAVLLNDPGPWSRVWRVLTTPEGCRAVAAIIRGWIGEDARALWERLRAEPVPDDEREAAARWLAIEARSFRPDGDGYKDYEAYAARGSRGVEVPEDVTSRRCSLLSRLRFPPSAAVSNLPAQEIEPQPPLPPGTYLYLDPPYQNTTGYQHQFPRADVLAVAARWSDAGAVVAVSEAEPLPIPGWHHVCLSGVRKGQKRTFSKQQVEWLTLNRKPAWVPEEQEGLFA